ncbi:MAG: DUF1648 domain-containing protein [Candidatus Aenigmarchaeota archaeon]|nr:DUF1648 domain-containing protein [Candidatus Aenigmarchaeota archaeon]
MRMQIALVIIILAFLMSVYFYPVLPSRLATHWNIDGQVDGYMSKAAALFIMPLISLILLTLFVIIPVIDPWRKNIKMFKKYFENFVLIIIGFLFYLHLLTMTWHLDYRFNMIQYMAPAFAVIFYYAGQLTQHAKRNWFIGIRTPWTLTNNRIWDKVNERGGKLFKACGIICLVAIFLPNDALFLILVPILATTAYVFVYSYVLYSRKK